MTPRPSDPDWVPPDIALLVRDLQTMEPRPATDALLERIQSGRRAGMRALLPVGDTRPPARHPSHWRWSLPALAAAGLVSVMIGRRTDARTEPIAAATSQADSLAGARSALGALVPFWPATAFAQAPTRPVAYAPITAVPRRRLRAGRRSFVQMIEDGDGRSTPMFAFEEVTDSVRVSGRLQWRVSITSYVFETRDGPRTNATAHGDTLWIADEDTRVVRREFRGGQRHIAERYTRLAMTRGDTIVMDPPQLRSMSHAAAASFMRETRRREVLPLDTTRVFVPTEAALRALLAQLPLTASWRGSIAVRSAEHIEAATWQPEFVNLRVAGADTVRSTTGVSPCWRVLVEMGDAAATWYVSQATGEALLVETPTYRAGRSLKTYLIAAPEPAPIGSRK